MGVSWKKIFEGEARPFDHQEWRDAHRWMSCALAENHPKFVQKLYATHGRAGTHQKGKGPVARINRALFELGLFFPHLVDSDRFDEARRVYNLMRVLVGKRPVHQKPRPVL